MSMRSVHGGRSALAALLVLGGCSLAPPYERPAPAIPPSWPTGDAYPQADGAPLPKLYQTGQIFDRCNLDTSG